MRKKATAKLLVLSAALFLPGLAAAQFPYSAWTCDRSEEWCSPALIPAEGEPAVYGKAPDGPDYTAVKPAVSDDAVKRFTSAFSKIQDITKTAETKIPQEATAEDTTEARNQAQSQALQALQAANIEREMYNQIAAFMNRDKELRARVMDSMN